MGAIVRILIAVLVGCLTTAILNYFGVLDSTINALIGLVAGLLVYFKGPETL